MFLYIQIALISTILFAGSWCLSNSTQNFFHLCLSFESYASHVGIWIGVFFVLCLVQLLAFKHSRNTANKLSLSLLILSPLNILDYGMRSIFGVTGSWPKGIVISWGIVTILILITAIVAAWKFTVSEKVIKKAIAVGIFPSLLFLYYGIQTSFLDLTIEKKIVKADKTPVHLMIFDMLSVDFLIMNGAVNDEFPQFKQFSQDCDLHINAYSPGITTGETIPRLLTGIDFKNVTHNKDDPWVVSGHAPSKPRQIADVANIFSIADDANYNVFLQAFAMPYTTAFSKQIQSGQVFPYDSLWKVGLHSLIWPILNPGGLAHQKTADSILSNYKERVISYSSNTFFYSHWNIPHPPYIYDSKGKNLGVWELRKQFVKKQDARTLFRNQLRGTDRIFGELISAMKNRKSYDKSLIIVTADTNVDGFEYDMKRVPILIKKPFQKRSHTINSKVYNINMKEFLKEFFLTGKIDGSILKR